MKKGDKVYAAAIAFGGGVVVEAATVVSVGEREVRLAGETSRGPGHAFGYSSRLRVVDGRIASSRVEAIGRLVERCRRDVGHAEKNLIDCRKTLAEVEAALAAEPTP